MSTKIYNAYKFLGTNEELVPFLVQVRSDVQEELIKLYKDLDISKKPIYEIYNTLCTFIEKSLTALNISSSVCVFFYKSEIYLQFYFPYDIGQYSLKANALFNKWKDKIADFHYQDQGDKPDEISEQEWAYRQNVWNELFEVSDIPALAGFTWIIADKANAMQFAFKLKQKQYEV